MDVLSGKSGVDEFSTELGFAAAPNSAHVKTTAGRLRWGDHCNAI